MNLIDRESLLEKIQFRIEPFGVVGATIKDCVEKTREIILNEPVVTDANVGSKWIPVTERLPEKGEVVLACGKRHATSGMFQGALRNNPKLWHWKGNTLKEVTHWMPLPEPPKEVE